MMRIDLRGAIVPDGEQWIYDWYGIPAVSPKRIMQQIDKAISSNEKELIVNINSPGGSVYAASEIWSHIKKFPGDSVAEITGVCASAASIIAMATKRTVIAPVGALMIHNASIIAQGDYREMEANAGMTFDVIGFGRLNGKYIVTRVQHHKSKITLDLRKCLEGY
ncbi:ATP-dependent Clp protease proteolytic subunit [Lysinibacillus sp. NPDC093210]|uniref:ATP-dependent Clp protease proteolytic subunit n=1 Tax=Lysinibacillus sp. NPDC093210 TaxID=3364133 RepID=UPI003802D71E